MYVATAQIIEPLGASDCEVVGAGLLAQPANALSSLAYVLVGLAIGAWGIWSARARAPWVGFGGVVVAIGIGSFLYHGPQIGPALWLHDASIAGAVAFIAAWRGGLALGWPTRRRWTAFVCVGVVAAVLIAMFPVTSIPVTVVLALFAAAAEFGARAAGARMPDGRYTTNLYAIGLALASAGLLLNAAGRTGGPLCDPDSVSQLHALWHIATAITLGGWASAGLRREPRRVLDTVVRHQMPLG